MSDLLPAPVTTGQLTTDNTAVYIKSSDSQIGVPSNNAYSYADIFCTLILPFQDTRTSKSPMLNLGGLSVLSISEHKDKFPVTSFGSSNVKGHTYGNKMIAGTLGFTVFGANPFLEAIERYADWIQSPKSTSFISPLDLPPFDICAMFVDMKGDRSVIYIKGVNLVDSGKTVDVNNIVFSDSYSFMATRMSLFIDNNTVTYSPHQQTPSPLPQTPAPFFQRKSVPNPNLNQIYNNNTPSNSGVPTQGGTSNGGSTTSGGSVWSSCNPSIIYINNLEYRIPYCLPIS